MNFIETSKRIEKFLIKCFTVFTGTLLIFTILFVVIAVLDRTVFKIGFFWTEELARTCYIWFSMSAPAIMITAGTQFACSYVVEKVLPPRKILILNVAIYGIMLVVLIALVKSGFQYVYLMRRQKMPTVNAPIALMYLSQPVGMIAISFMTIIHIFNLIVEYIHPKEKPAETAEV
jgi:TRAP-type C4-dicarboxylate transport system permease small subunit